MEKIRRIFVWIHRFLDWLFVIDRPSGPSSTPTTNSNETTNNSAATQSETTETQSDRELRKEN
jgi:hypothetical protein